MNKQTKKKKKTLDHLHKNIKLLIVFNIVQYQVQFTVLLYSLYLYYSLFTKLKLEIYLLQEMWALILVLKWHPQY